MQTDKASILSAFYDNEKSKVLMIRQYGVTRTLSELRELLRELESATLLELNHPEYEPATYNLQVALIRSASKMAAHIEAMQATYFLARYIYNNGLTYDILRGSLTQMEQKANELVITQRTVGHWKALAVLLEGIDVLYSPVDDEYEHPADSTQALTLHLKKQSMSTDNQPLKSVSGLGGDVFARSCKAVATKLRGKIQQYEARQDLPLNGLPAHKGIPLGALNTVDDQPELSKIMGLQSLLNGHQLSREQAGRLATVRQEVISRFTAYLSTTWLNALYAPPNAALAKEALTLFENEFDPKKQLEYLLQLRDKLIEARSVNLLPQLNDILVAAYNLLRITDAEPEPATPLRMLRSHSSSSGE